MGAGGEVRSEYKTNSELDGIIQVIIMYRRCMCINRWYSSDNDYYVLKV